MELFHVFLIRSWVVGNTSNCAVGRTDFSIGYFSASRWDPSEKHKAGSVAFAGVKRPRLAEKPKSNREKKKRTGDGLIGAVFCLVWFWLVLLGNRRKKKRKHVPG